MAPHPHLLNFLGRARGLPPLHAALSFLGEGKVVGKLLVSSTEQAICISLYEILFIYSVLKPAK